MRSFLLRHRFYIFSTLVVLLCCGLLLLLLPKGQMVIWLNGSHTALADFFFKFYTNAGDGLIYAIAIVILLFIRVKYALAAAGSLLGTTILVQAGKHWLFPRNDRPLILLRDLYEVYQVPGVTVHSYNSFPSGHTATAFAMFTILALMAKSKSAQLCWLFLAVLVGISRMYLAQHFLVDVTAGATIGFIVSLTVYFLLCEKYVAAWGERPLMNRT